MLTLEPLMPESSAFEVEMAVEKLKGHKSKGIDEIPAELIKAGGRTNRSEIHELVNCIWNKVELSEEWKESIVLPVCERGDKTDCNNYRGISLLSSAVKVNSTCTGSTWGSLWISMQRVSYLSYILHPSNTGENMGIQLSSASAIYRLQDL